MGERPVRLQLSRRKGFNLQALSLATNGLPAVNVARPSRWGNPFPNSIGHDLCLKMFRDLLRGFFDPYLLEHLRDDEFKVIYDAKSNFEKRLYWGASIASAPKAELAGKNLACWCKPGEPCHADVLLDLANPPTHSQERG